MRDEATYRSTIVTVNPGCSIFINGTLIVSGQLSGGTGGTAYSSHTAGYYAKLVLKDEVLISVSSTGALKVMGEIFDESSSDKAASIDIRGALYQPIVIRDFKGGSITAAAYKGMSNYKYSPFNQFQFINITAKVTIHSGANFYTYANLYAGEQHNTSLACFIGNSSSSFIQLSQGARLESKYDKGSDILDAHFYGGFVVNGFSLNAAGQTVNSSMFTFPISWLLNITLDTVDGTPNTSATYTMMQEYKLLPGAILNINAGATVSVIKLNVYETFNDELATSRYPADKSPARLTVNGTLVAGQLGGKVYTSNTTGTAKVKATTLPSAVTYEIISVSGSSIFASAKGKDITLPLELYSVNGTLISSTQAGVEYFTVNGIWQIPDYFELEVGEGFSVTVTEWWSYDTNGNLVKNTNASGQTFTTGSKIYLPTAGANVTYTPASNYVVFTDITMDLSSLGKPVTKTIYGPLLVKKALITSKDQITVNDPNRVRASMSIVLIDANSDGICEVQLSFETEGWLRATEYKINVNGEIDENENLVYQSSASVSGDWGMVYQRLTTAPIYGSDIVINVAKK